MTTGQIARKIVAKLSKNYVTLRPRIEQVESAVKAELDKLVQSGDITVKPEATIGHNDSVYGDR